MVNVEKWKTTNQPSTILASVVIFVLQRKKTKKAIFDSYILATKMILYST